MSFWSNLRGPRQHFDGGLFLPDHKAVTARCPIEDIEVDGPLHVPLQVGRGLPTAVEVVVGDRVLGGQRLAAPTRTDSASVHAPTSGTITAVERVWTAADGYLPGVVLEPDGQDEWHPPPRTWVGESFIRQLADCGVVCTSPRGPAHAVMAQAAEAGVTDLIINAMETEPYLTADLRTLVEEPGRMIDTTCEIADALGAHRALFALPFRHRRVVKRMEAEAQGRYVEIAPLANRYPQCDPIVLVKTLLDREVPPGESSLEVAALVLPLATVRAAAQALLDGRPVARTVMSIAGDAVDRPGTYRVPVGTPMRRVAQRAGIIARVGQAISGGPLTGIPLGNDEAVVTVDTTALLLFSTTQHLNPVPCVHCGWCVEDCPVGLDPSELIHLEAQDSCNAVDLAHLYACVDCGLCSYVCPAQLPLAATIKRTRLRFAQWTRAGKLPVAPR
ncbi:MAG: RnfABCDGE type electron transport complex subunit C [Phycisphaerae bacterium]|nr:RnfABCDGE type electron transport complex subunit C [Phycisphaerae bacterium]